MIIADLVLILVLFIILLASFLMIYFTYKAYLKVYSKDINGIMKWLEDREIAYNLIMVLALAMVINIFICVCIWK